VYVDGILVGRQDVLRAGGYLYYYVGRPGHFVRLQSVDATYPTPPGSNETVVGNIQIY
jgi:hypothetical protein